MRKKPTESTPASKPSASTTTKTKETQTAPGSDVTGGMTDVSKNTSSTVWVNGKSGYEYILVPKGTDASAVTEAQWALNGQRPKTEDGSDVELTFDRTYNASGEGDKNVQPGTEYQVLVRKPGSDTLMPSDAKSSEVTYTKQTAPELNEILNNAQNGISIDYKNETVTINGDTYEVYVPADGTAAPSGETAATVSGSGSIGSITPAIEGDRKIYVRKKANGSVPASEWIWVDINGRPETPPAVPEIPNSNVTNNTVTIPEADKNCEYIVVKKTNPQTVPTEEQWRNNSTSLGGGEQTGSSLTLNKDNEGNGLEAGTEYEVIVRRKPTESTPASKPSEPVAVTTKNTQEAPGEDVTAGMVNGGNNTVSTVWVNAKAGYEYILVPNGTDASVITEEQWRLNGKTVSSEDGSDVELIFDRTYNAAGEDDKNIQPGTEYIVLVRKPGDDTDMPSPSVSSEVTSTKTQEINPGGGPEEPGDPNAGNIKNTTDKESNVMGADISDNSAQLSEKLLTDEEKQLVQEGEHVKVFLQVKNIADSVPEEDKSMIDQSVQGQVLSMYLDISLYKHVGEREPERITGANGSVAISFQLEGDAVNTDANIVRTYSVLRIHDGELSVLPCTYDETSGVITFETDRFSTYALIYNDTPREPENPTEPENPSEPENPTEPENPSEPENPTEPENPSEPETPTETEPETPSETQPETPGETEPEVPSETESESPSEVEAPRTGYSGSMVLWVCVAVAIVMAGMAMVLEDRRRRIHK